jgi:hypothetical protein
MNRPFQFERTLRKTFYAGLFAGAVIGFAFASGTCKADSLIINGYSVHLGGGDFNELNYGMGFIHDFRESHPLGSNYVHGGVYRNSYRDTSTYAAIGWDVLRLSRHVTVGAEMGVVTGYRIMPVAPMLVPVVSIGPVRMLGLLPGCASCVGAVGFQYEVKLP